MEPTCNIPEWLTGIGTILLAIVAIFQDKIRQWLAKPKLECSIEMKPPDAHKTILRYNGKKCNSYYFLFRIENKGKIGAKNVEAVILSVERKRGNEFERIDNFLPDNLGWSGKNNEICSFIMPNTFKHCTLGHILEPSHRVNISGEDNSELPVSAEEAILNIDVRFKSNNLAYLFEPGTYRVNYHHQRWWLD